MKFDKDALGLALKVWRESRGLSAVDVAKLSKMESTTPFTVATVYKWEKGNKEPKPKKPVYPSFDRLVDDILPAYGITSLDQFLLFYCSHSQPDLNTIRLIRHSDLNKSEKLRVHIAYADPELLGEEHPFRIDTIVVPDKKASKPASHKGRNYLLVIEGKVKCHFTDHTKKKQTFPLSAGDAVAFDTILQHNVEAVDGDARIVVARSTWGNSVDEE